MEAHYEQALLDHRVGRALDVERLPADLRCLHALFLSGEQQLVDLTLRGRDNRPAAQDYSHGMSDPQFKPPPVNHDIEVQFEGKTHKGQYHLERDNIVVSYQGASKMIAQGTDNDTLARTILTEIVTAKRGRH
jgi:hypothetical protein